MLKVHRSSMLQLILGHGGKSTHKYSGAERSPLVNVETEPGTWTGACSCLSVESSVLLKVETEPIFSVYPTSHLCVVLHFLIFFIFMQFSAKIMQHSEILRFRTITNGSFQQRNRTFYCRKKWRNFDCTAGKSLYVEHF